MSIECSNWGEHLTLQWLFNSLIYFGWSQKLPCRWEDEDSRGILHVNIWILFCLEPTVFQNTTFSLVWVYGKIFPFVLNHFKLCGKDLHKCLGLSDDERCFYWILWLWLQSQQLTQSISVISIGNELSLWKSIWYFQTLAQPFSLTIEVQGNLVIDTL